MASRPNPRCMHLQNTPLLAGNDGLLHAVEHTGLTEGAKFRHIISTNAAKIRRFMSLTIPCMGPADSGNSSL